MNISNVFVPVDTTAAQKLCLGFGKMPSGVSVVVDWLYHWSFPISYSRTVLIGIYRYFRISKRHNFYPERILTSGLPGTAPEEGTTDPPMKSKTPSPPWSGRCIIAPFSYTPAGSKDVLIRDSCSGDCALSNTIKLVPVESPDQDPSAKDLSKDGTLQY